MKQYKSAKAARLRTNVIVHIILAVLAVIWIFPVLWVIMTSFRAEKGSYVSTFFPQGLTLECQVAACRSVVRETIRYHLSPSSEEILLD